MKRKIIFGSIILIAIGSGLYFWKLNFDCENQCKADTEMSLICQQTCAAKDSDTATLIKSSEATIGDHTTCPVSGVAFVVNTESVQVSYLGKSAYTCCSRCAEIFNEGPSKFAGNIN